MQLYVTIRKLYGVLFKESALQAKNGERRGTRGV